MKVKDLSLDQIVVGLKIQSLISPGKTGTVVKIDKDNDDYAWILWEGENQPFSGFYGNDCECELAEG